MQASPAVRTSNKFAGLVGGGSTSKTKSKRERRRQAQKSKSAPQTEAPQQEEDDEEENEDSEEIEEPQPPKREAKKPTVTFATTKASPEIKRSVPVKRNAVVTEVIQQGNYSEAQVLAAQEKLEREGVKVDSMSLLKAVQQAVAEEERQKILAGDDDEDESSVPSQNGVTAGSKHEEKRPQNGAKKEVEEDVEEKRPIETQKKKEDEKVEIVIEREEKDVIDWSNPHSLERAAAKWDSTTKEGQQLVENWVSVLSKAKAAKAVAISSGDSNEKGTGDESWKAYDVFLKSDALENFVERLLGKYPPSRTSQLVMQNIGSIFRLCLTDAPSSDVSYQRWLLSQLSTLSTTLIYCSNKEVFLQKIRQVITTQKRSMSSHTHIIQLVKEEDASRSGRQRAMPSPSERKAAEAKYTANSSIAGFFERAGADAGPLRRLWDLSLQAAIQLQGIESKVKKFRDALKTPQDDQHRAFTALEKAVTDDIEKKRQKADEKAIEKQDWLQKKANLEAQKRMEVGALTAEEIKCQNTQRTLLTQKSELERELNKINVRLDHEEKLLAKIQQDIQAKSAFSTQKIQSIEEQINVLSESTGIFEKDKVCAEAICKLIVGISRQMSDLAIGNTTKLSKVWGETSREYLRKATDQILAQQQLVNFLTHRVSVLERKVKEAEDHTKKDEYGTKKFEGFGMEDLGLKKIADSAAQLRKEMTDMIKQDNEVIDQIIKSVRQTLDTIASVLQESLTIPGLSSSRASQDQLYQTAEQFLKRLDDQRVSFVDLTSVRQFVPSQSSQSTLPAYSRLVSLPDHSSTPPQPQFPPQPSTPYYQPAPSPSPQYLPQQTSPQYQPQPSYHLPPQYQYPQQYQPVYQPVFDQQSPYLPQQPPPQQQPPSQVSPQQHHVSRSLPSSHSQQSDLSQISSQQPVGKLQRSSFAAKQKRLAGGGSGGGKGGWTPVNKSRGIPSTTTPPTTVSPQTYVPIHSQQTSLEEPQQQSTTTAPNTSYQPSPSQTQLETLPVQDPTPNIIIIEPTSQQPSSQTEIPITHTTAEVSPSASVASEVAGSDPVDSTSLPSSTLSSSAAASSVVSSPTRPIGGRQGPPMGTPTDSKISYATKLAWGGAGARKANPMNSLLPGSNVPGQPEAFPLLPSSPSHALSSAPTSSTPAPSSYASSINSPAPARTTSTQQSTPTRPSSSSQGGGRSSAPRGGRGGSSGRPSGSGTRPRGSGRGGRN